VCWAQGWRGSVGNLSRVRVLGLIVAVGALAFVAAGCSDSSPPQAVPEKPRSPLAKKLAALCDESRAATEALGLPGDKGFAVVPPTAEIGIRLGKDVGRLKAPTKREQAKLDSISKDLQYYFGEMRAGAKLYKIGQPDAYVQTMERAKSVLVRAEKTATQLGAPECAVRPFPDV
jgi:hypothetical protein